MTGLLDGLTLPWDFISGPVQQPPKPDPLVAERARQRRHAEAQRAAAIRDQEARAKQAATITNRYLTARAAARSMAESLRRLTTTEETQTP